MSDKSIEPSNKKTKRILVVRDSITPEGAYAVLFCCILIWVWTYAAYSVTRDLQEPILMPDTILHKGSYYIIDSNSYLVFLSISIVMSIATICCFRFGHKEITQ